MLSCLSTFQVRQAQARVIKDNDYIYYQRAPQEVPEDALPPGKRVVEATVMALPPPSPLASTSALEALATAVAKAQDRAGTPSPNGDAEAVSASLPSTAGGAETLHVVPKTAEASGLASSPLITPPVPAGPGLAPQQGGGIEGVIQSPPQPSLEVEATGKPKDGLMNRLKKLF